MSLKGRSFLTLMDFNKEEIRYLLDLAHKLKADKKRGRRAGGRRTGHSDPGYQGRS